MFPCMRNYTFIYFDEVLSHDTSVIVILSFTAIGKQHAGQPNSYMAPYPFEWWGLALLISAVLEKRFLLAGRIHLSKAYLQI